MVLFLGSIIDINTHGGAYIDGGVNVGGDFVARDQTIIVQILRIARVSIPVILIIAVILIAMTQMTGYDLRPAIDTLVYGATPTPSYPICAITINENSCLPLSKQASSNSDVFGCLQDGTNIQVTGIADPYYQISSFGIESEFSKEQGVMVKSIGDAFGSDTPAYHAGLRVGDIILRYDDLIIGEVTDEEMIEYAAQRAGSQMDIFLIRQNQELTVTVFPKEPMTNRSGAYISGPVGFQFTRVVTGGAEINRAFVLGYTVQQSVNILKGQSSVDTASYVSCPSQLIQPYKPKE